MAYVFIESLIVGPWETNCYLLGASDTSQVVVIDPGFDAAEAVGRALEDNRKTLAGVIATHGHVDHIADAAKLANQAEVPMWLHSGDDYMLTTPLAGLDARSAQAMSALVADELPAPNKRVDLAGLANIEVAGLRLGVLHAPGHTPGCVLLTGQDEQGPIVWCGDVVFAGSVGRTDLPGGDPEVMRRSLREVVFSLDDAVRLLPGHGPATTMARERRLNPYFQTGGL